jgi:hypothetical protein
MSKFRFHWGWAIALFYSLFVITMLVIVVKSFTVDNALVVENYYDYDITYQEHADKKANTRALEKDLEFEHDRVNKVFKIVYPANFTEYSGSVLFYKPDNKKLDFEVVVNPDQSKVQSIDLSEIVGGYWRIKINWNGDGTAFYKEHSIFN